MALNKYLDIAPEVQKALDEAKTVKDRDTAVADMGYLLNDNVEVITAPPQAPV